MPDIFKIGVSACSNCSLAGMISPEISCEKGIEVDLVDHAVIGVRELRSEVRQKWKKVGLRYGTINSPISVRTGEVSDNLSEELRRRMGSAIIEGTSSDEFKAALIQCSKCVTAFEIAIN